MTDLADEHVSRAEFTEALQHLESRMDRLIGDLSTKLDSRGASVRQVWMGVASIVVTLMALGAGLVAFSMSAATSPLYERQQAEMRRLDMIQELLVRDMRIEHGAGTGGADTSARLEQTRSRQDELWQLLQTLDLKLDKLSERLIRMEE